MTLLEAAIKKGAEIVSVGENQYARGCPYDHGLETKEQSNRVCGELRCWECYAREYKGTPIEETEERTPEQPGEETEEKRYEEGMPCIAEMEKVTITKAEVAAEICFAEHKLLARLIDDVKNSGVDHEMAVQYLVGVNVLAEMVMRRLEEC